jgi:hypothetical protein
MSPACLPRHSAVAYLFLVRRMRARFAVTLLMASLLTGCDTFGSHEYCIAHATPTDTAHVQRILRDVAGIPKRAPTFYDSPTIALYRDSKVQLRAGIEHGDIRVMLMRYDWPAPKAFRRADSLLMPALSATFGHQLAVEPPADVERIIKVY